MATAKKANDFKPGMKGVILHLTDAEAYVLCRVFGNIQTSDNHEANKALSLGKGIRAQINKWYPLSGNGLPFGGENPTWNANFEIPSKHLGDGGDNG